MPDLSFDEARNQTANHIRRVVAEGRRCRGPMRPPEIDLTSTAAHQLGADGDLGDERIEAPVASVFAHLERLLFAADDQANCVAELLAKPEPSWFGHLAVTRSAVESLSRVWYLSAVDLDPIQRVTRLLNEHLVELNHGSSLLNGPLRGLPPDLFDQAQAHIADERSRLTSWATDHGVAYPGGYLGDRRPGPLDLLAAIYEAEGSDPAASVLGAWHYSQLSSVAHGLPDGMSRYLVAPDATSHEPRLELTSAELVHSIDPLLTLYDAAARQCSRFFRWPLSDNFNAEMLAARMFVNRASGLVD